MNDDIIRKTVDNGDEVALLDGQIGITYKFYDPGYGWRSTVKQFRLEDAGEFVELVGVRGGDHGWALLSKNRSLKGDRQIITDSSGKPFMTDKDVLCVCSKGHWQTKIVLEEEFIKKTLPTTEVIAGHWYI